MVSLPDYDPNNPQQANDPTRINRLTTGVFEMGSTFKALTLAMALDSGHVTLNSMLRCARLAALRQVPDPRLSRPEPLADACRRCSPIRRTSAPRGWRSVMGVEHHKWFLKKLGQLDRLRTELPESAEPIVPKRWGELNTVTIAFGHGLSVAPLQAVAGHQRAGERRLSHSADLPEAHAGRGDEARQGWSSSLRPARRCAT